MFRPLYRVQPVMMPKGAAAWPGLWNEGPGASGSLMALYPDVRTLHVGLALLSGGLFLLRGLGLQRRAAWPMLRPVRLTTYVVDSALLAAGVTLFVMLPAPAFANGWLTTKLALIAIYIVLGSYGLARGRTPGVRLACFLGAMFVYLNIIGVAVTHQPLGLLTLLSR